MPVITLTTDLGTRDYYVAAVKGELLKAIPGVTLADISHNIEPFNILNAAFVLKNSYRHFPENTIHLVGVNSFNTTELSALIVHHDHQYFVGADNGLFGLVWEENIPKEIYRVTLSEEEKKSTLPMRDVYVRIAKHLSENKSPNEISTIVPSFKILTLGKPVISNGYIRGNVIYFDRFGNAMVNIRKEEFEKTGSGRRFVIMFKRYSDVVEISLNYSDVEESEKLCLFNSSGYLEIAINKGNAQGLLNLNVGDPVQIDFQS